MARTLAHRGPDDEGFLNEPPVGLGHRRLSIIDVESGHQPLSNEDGTVWIVYNGEVYNHDDLRRRYLSDHKLRTHCDTEVIVHLYEEFGDRCVEYLRGMFAFAIWDKKRHRLLLARDRFGIKPLYYVRTRHGFAFASELKALVEAGCVDTEVNKDAIEPYLTFRYVPGSQTMLKGVRKLEPAHLMVVGQGQLDIRRYWSLGYAKEEGQTEEYYGEKLTEGLREAISIRLMSEVPLGAFLSGGLDSSFVVGLMSELKSDPVSTFTASLEGGWHDEADFAQLVASHFGTDHHPLKVRADASDILPKIIWHLDEPLGDAATVPTYLLSQLTRDYVTVVLTGEGADELLAGYDKYKAFKYGSVVRKLIGGPYLKAAAQLVARTIHGERLFGFMSNRNDVDAYLDLVSVYTWEEKQRLAGPELDFLRSKGARQATSGAWFDDFSRETDVLDRLQQLDIDTWLPNDVLLKVDRMSMAHSLEARVPFLDHEFAQFLTSIPNRYKLRGLREKYILRKAMRPLVPREIVGRRKHGFTVPIQRWMKGELKAVVGAALSRPRLEELGYWHPTFVGQLLKRDLNNEYYRRQLWVLVVFDMWHRIFIEGERPA